MKDPSDIIRIWLYNTLNGTVSYQSAAVPYYSFAPKDQTMPYILLISQSSGSELEESTKTGWITKHSFTLDIYASSASNDGSFKSVNTIGNSVLQLVRTRTAIPMTGYQVISCTYDGGVVDSIDMDKYIVFLKTMNFTLTIEEQ